MTQLLKPMLNFSGGEASPKIKGRIDTTQYYTLAETIENFLGTHYGSVFRTPGKKFVHRVKSIAKKTRVVPFIFSTGDSYILEFGEYYIRFFSDSGSVVGTALNITNISKASEAVVTCNTSTLSDGDYIDIEGVVGMTQVNNKRFIVSDKTSTTIKIKDEDSSYIDSSDYGAYASGGTIEKIYEIASPYAEDDLADLKFSQQGDIMYIAHGSYEQRKLSRFASTNWTLSTFDFDEFNWPPFLDINTTAYTITPSATTGTITLTASSGSDLFNTNHVGSYWKISHGSVIGYVKITHYTSATSVTATVISTLGGTTATDDWYEGAWSNDEGWPVDCVFFENRLIFVKDLKFWGSETESYENYDNGTDEDATEDTDPFKYTIGSNQIDKILWCYATDVLVLGTAGGPFVASSGSDALPITPTNISVKQINEVGASSISPVRIGPFLYYAQRSNRKIGQIVYSIDYDSYGTEDITYLNDHILKDGDGIVDIAVQQHPYDIMWCVLDDGSLATMTREVQNNVRCWTRQNYGTDGYIEHIAVIPNGAEDQVWCVVRRVIDSVTVRYIEYYEVIDFASQEDCFFVDSGLTYDGTATTSITGLDHLEGKTVAVLIDGAAHPNCVVSSGAITLSWSGSKVQVGLPYTSTLKTLDFANASVASVTEVIIRFLDSLGCKFGDGTTQDTIPFQQFGSLLNQAPDLFTGDKRVDFPSGHDFNKYIKITQEQPLPLHILGLFPKYDTAR